MTIDKTLYTNDSIVSLNPREFTRLRPATYLGSNEYSTQLVREVFSNALDEHIIGHGSIINVSINTESNLYTVEDQGQGFPINVIKENETILQASFDKFNTSGKYDDNGVYSGSVLGLNGIGNKLTNFLALNLDVISYSGKEFEHVWFKEGIFERREIGHSSHPSGTIVRWTPDPQFFQNKEANVSELKKLFEDISALCPTLTIKLKVDDKEFEYHSKNGIQDLLDTKVGNKEIISNRFVARKIEDPYLFDISLTYTSDYSESITAYVNYGLTESGAHIATVKAGITRQINKYALDNNLIKKAEDQFTQAELSEGLVIVFNVKSANVKYDSQTKVRVVDLDKTLINSIINNDFKDWLNNNPKIVKQIIDKALIARKAKDAAQKAKEGIRNAGTKGKKFISLPTKLVDAYSKNRYECSLIICEGDSAANGLLAKRDGKTQAIFPIRGKILNCTKATVDKVYANQEISNIVKALGLDIDKSSGKLIYDTKKLRYGNILIATDADEDGYQIRLLLINMFWWLCPELVINGHLGAVVPPLFRITTKKNEYIYLKDHAELDHYNKKHKNESFTVGRLKGIGEMSPDESKYCLLDPATRHVEQIIVNDAEQTSILLDTFMGSSVEPRRDYLLAHIADIKEDL